MQNKFEPAITNQALNKPNVLQIADDFKSTRNDWPISVRHQIVDYYKQN